jgi:tyrosine-protein kinase Etk/Wzc
MGDSLSTDYTNKRDVDEVDMIEILSVLYRRRQFIVVFNLVVVGLTLAFAIASLLLPPEISPLPNLYRPHALLLVNDDRVSATQAALSASGVGQLATLAGISSSGGYGELARRVLGGNSIIDTIIAEFDIIKRYKIERYPVANSREAVEDRAFFDFDAATNTLSIAFKDYNPQFARDVTNRFVELLVQRFRSIGVNRNITERDLLQNRQAEVEAEIARLEDSVESFQRLHGVVTAQSLGEEQVKMLAEVRSRLIFKELEIDSYSEFARAPDPVMTRLQSERDNLRALLTEMEQGYNRYDDIMPSQQEIPRLAIEFGRLQRDLEVQARIYEILSQQYEIAKLNAQGEKPIFQVLEMADAPDKKDSPRRSIIMIVTAFASLFVSVIMAFVLNAVSAVRNDPEAMKRIRGKQRS